MNDNTLPDANMRSVDGDRKNERSTWPTASTRVSPDEMHLLDAAAYKLGIKRAQLVRHAALERARAVLGFHPAV